jgi:DNA-binding protein H-NS
MTELAKLSLEKLQDRLSQLDAEWYAVQHEIDERKEQDKRDLLEEIRAKISTSGYSVADIAIQLRGRGRGRRMGAQRGDRAYITYVDPDDPFNTYTRGPLPTWLKDKMKAAGVDPGDKGQRELFKQQHLKRK